MGDKENVIYVASGGWGWKTWKTPLWRRTHRWQEDINVDIEDTVCESKDRSHL